MLIIDASVALKWVIEEDGSVAARELLVDEDLAAPDLLWSECANVLWTKVRRQQISREAAIQAFAAIDGAPIRVVPSRPLAKAAQLIALELDQTVYDSLYLAAALAERTSLITADAAFAKAVAAHPVYCRSCRGLIGTS